MSDNRMKSNKIGPKLDLNLVKLQGGPKMNDFKPTY